VNAPANLRSRKILKTAWFASIAAIAAAFVFGFLVSKQPDGGGIGGAIVGLTVLAVLVLFLQINLVATWFIHRSKAALAAAVVNFAVSRV